MLVLLYLYVDINQLIWVINYHIIILLVIIMLVGLLYLYVINYIIIIITILVLW